MAYQFKKNESISEAAQRIAREELNEIVNQLRQNRNRDLAIHEARKSVKKTRALLRLIEPQLGARYRRESRVLRDAGRNLSELRDTGAVIEIFDALKKRYPDQMLGSKIAALRRTLVDAKKEADRHAGVPGVLSEIANSVEAVRKRVKKWHIAEDGFQAIEPGFKKSLRASRKAFGEAQKLRRPENYHEWRKRIKDHWYHIRLIENLWTDVLRGYEKSLEDIERCLGDDHNLTLLHDRLADSSGAASVRHMIVRYQKELRHEAESLGQTIHEEKPSDFVRRMRKLWKA